MNEFLRKLWRGEFAPREAWAIADYVAVAAVALPYILLIAVFLAGALYAHYTLWR